MRNYFFSTVVHVILLLLLFGLTLGSRKNEPKKEQHFIMVDFSKVEESNQPVQPQASKAQASPSPKAIEQETVEKAVRVKTIEKKTLQLSQKPKAESSKVLTEKSTVVKKVVPPLASKPTAEEIAEANRKKEEKARQKRKDEKRSQFSSLLSKAKNKTAADQDRLEMKKEATGSHTSASSNSLGKNKNIRGVLGNRKVLQIPSIKDNSQKKGRVVVKICVGSDGKVISSKYTMMGSTTSDSYLIKLAEDGASKYIFSTSTNPKECGNVIIDFQLK